MNDLLTIGRMKKQRTANRTFAIGGVSSSADSFAVKGSSVLRMKFCAKIPRQRKPLERWQITAYKNA